MKKIFILLVLTSVFTFAQVELSHKNSKKDFLPFFYIDVAGYKLDNLDLAKLDIFIKVPYSRIQFIKDKNSYYANYALIISLYDDDDNLKLEKLWMEKITAPSFVQTTSKKNFNISYKSFKVKPGNYKFICRLEDNNSRKVYTYKSELVIKQFDTTTSLSDVILVSSFLETGEGTKIIPNISNIISSKDTSLSFYYEIYSPIEQTVDITYRIKNLEDQILIETPKTYTVKQGRNEINETLNGVQFALGRFKLEVVLKDELQIEKRTNKQFSSQLFGFPPSIQDLDLAIEQMQFIATPNEIDEIQEEENYDNRLKKFINYWKKLDPSPNTVENETLNEYYRRVDYANAHFKGYFKGWKSDMGMIYITLGPPDQVTRRPFQMDSKPYEVWDYYSLNRSFIFVDQTNFGDYRLMNPSYGDWFRYRP